MADEIKKDEEVKSEESTSDEDTKDEFGVPASVHKVLEEMKSEVKEEPEEETKEESVETDEDTEESVESETEEEPEEGEEKPEGPPSEDYEEIDPRLVAAARARGWSDEKIVSVAEEDESILEALVDTMETVRRERPVSRKAPVAKTKEAIEKVKLDAEALKDWKEHYGDDVVDKVISPLAET